jgi:hypothetical protein
LRGGVMLAGQVGVARTCGAGAADGLARTGRPLRCTTRCMRARASWPTLDCLIVSLEVCLIAPAQADSFVRSSSSRRRPARADPGLHPHALGPETSWRRLAQGGAGEVGRCSRRPFAGETHRLPRPASLACEAASARTGGWPAAPSTPRCWCCGSTAPSARRWPCSTATAVTRPRSAPRISLLRRLAVGGRPLDCRGPPGAEPIFQPAAHADVDPGTRGVKDPPRPADPRRRPTRWSSSTRAGRRRGEGGSRRRAHASLPGARSSRCASAASRR